MLYAIIIALLAAFGGGFGLSHQLDATEINHITAMVEANKLAATAELSAIQTRVDQAQNEALAANANLEQAHVSAIQTINTLHASLSTARLRDPGSRQHCSSALPGRASARESETAADPGDLSAELTSFLLDQSLKADTVAEYASACYKFVSTNCGINPQ